jgi:hypothetical protein
MTIIFADERKPSTVLAYAAKTADYDYEIGIQVLQCNRSKWASTYKEENLVSTGGAPLDVRTVRSASGSEGVVVILTFSGAGTTTDWHVIAKRDRRFIKLDPSTVRNRLLQRRHYVFMGYNGVTLRHNYVIEEIPGYSRGQARCCPDRPSLIVAFKFTGSSLQLTSVKEKPALPAPE